MQERPKYTRQSFKPKLEPKLSRIAFLSLCVGLGNLVSFYYMHGLDSLFLLQLFSQSIYLAVISLLLDFAIPLFFYLLYQSSLDQPCGITLTVDRLSHLQLN